MPTVTTNEIETYYERHGEGQPLVCIHDAWTDHRLRNPHLHALSTDYEEIVYDVRITETSTRQPSVDIP